MPGRLPPPGFKTWAEFRAWKGTTSSGGWASQPVTDAQLKKLVSLAVQREATGLGYTPDDRLVTFTGMIGDIRTKGDASTQIEIMQNLPVDPELSGFYIDKPSVPRAWLLRCANESAWHRPDTWGGCPCPAHPYAAATVTPGSRSEPSAARSEPSAATVSPAERFPEETDRYGSGYGPVPDWIKEGMFFIEPGTDDLLKVTPSRDGKSVTTLRLKITERDDPKKPGEKIYKGSYSHSGQRPLRTGVLSKRDLLTPKRAAALGHAYGFCVYCGRSLDDPESVRNGMGRHCWQHYARPFGTPWVKLDGRQVPGYKPGDPRFIERGV